MSAAVEAPISRLPQLHEHQDTMTNVQFGSPAYRQCSDSFYAPRSCAGEASQSSGFHCGQPTVEPIECTQPTPMLPVELAVRMTTDYVPFLVLDCRSFIAFNLCHISEALNIGCSDRVTRKRLHCGRVQLEDLLGSPEAKEMFRKRSDIIVYDDRTQELTQSTAANSLHLLLSLLCRQGKRAYFIKGKKQFVVFVVLIMTIIIIIIKPRRPDLIRPTLTMALAIKTFAI